MRERLVDPHDGRDVRGLKPARQIRDRFHVERAVLVVDRTVIEAGRLDDPGNAARGELLEPGTQRRPSFAHRPPYAVFFHDTLPALVSVGWAQTLGHSAVLTMSRMAIPLPQSSLALLPPIRSVRPL